SGLNSRVHPVCLAGLADQQHALRALQREIHVQPGSSDHLGGRAVATKPQRGARICRAAVEGVGTAECPCRCPSVCVQLPASEETLESALVLLSLLWPRRSWPQPGRLATLWRRDALDRPALCSRSQEDPIYIECEAPEGYPGANFTLYQGEHVVQLLQAPADQFKVTFNLSGGSRDPSGGPFNCQYGVLGEHMRPQLSEHSDTVDIPPGSTRILVLSLSLAGALLLAGLVTLAVVVRKVKVKKLQKKRERESCWAQMNFDTTDMSFDNSLFAISSKMTSEEDAATVDARPGSAVTPGHSESRNRPSSTSSSPEPREFSTFRGCQ
uniref:C19orf38 Ig domain-containing protein n=1 Tax=Equus asinus TaxID=9793 RepID=A0A9L0K5U3_EQUAS